MTETAENSRQSGNQGYGAGMAASEVNAWFVREVLPLEAALRRYLRNSWRNDSDVGDMCQDIFVRALEAGRKEIPYATRPFVFSIARNLLLDRLHRNQIVSIDAVADMFFNAIDGGIDSHRDRNVLFHGPYATISIGLGG